MLGDERFQLRNEIFVVAQQDVAGDSRFQRHETTLVEPLRRPSGKRRIEDVCKGGTPPKRDCSPQYRRSFPRVAGSCKLPAALELRLEALQIELTAAEDDPIT